MKYALQLYGVFRTFDFCLPHILNYIMYETHDYDVFILSQRADGYSLENEKRIMEMLGEAKGRQIVLKYVEDCNEHENDLCKQYNTCVKDAKKKIQSELVTNEFVTRMWYRRRLNNQMRIDYEREHQVTYDWVIRTRFDIGYRTLTNRVTLAILNQLPKPNTMYMYPDTFSCGSPEVINYESELIYHWPYVYNKYLETGQLAEMSNNFQTIRKWLFMSEMNLIQFFKGSTYAIQMLSHDLKIVRRSMIDNQFEPDIKNDHVTEVYYGHGDKWINVTDTFIELFVSQYDNRENGAVIKVNNSLAKCDPAPYCVKNLVITTLEGDEYVYKEHTAPLIKYQHFYQVNCSNSDIQKVTFGIGVNQSDVTKRFMSKMKHRKKFVYISNSLSDKDPDPGVEKVLTIITNNGAKYEFSEYAIIELTS